jgi:SAM-dependent methyltransferase
MKDPTKRFSSRVHHYRQYRPGYPEEVIATLRDACGLTPRSTVADIGSGTGFLSELFLENGNPVYAVEPNPEMREAGERLLGRYPGFRSIDGRAEATALPDKSIDFIVTGQAFHWFDPEKTRLEFSRILKPEGVVMIVWNEREASASPFMTAYEENLRRNVPGYPELNYRQIYNTSVSRFFGDPGFRTARFRYRQELDYEGTLGRLLSSSYTPEAGHPGHTPMIEGLGKIFDTYQANGRVAFEYATRMYYGPLL